MSPRKEIIVKPYRSIVGLLPRVPTTAGHEVKYIVTTALNVLRPRVGEIITEPEAERLITDGINVKVLAK